MVRIWDVRTGELLEGLRGHKDGVYSVAFAPDGRGLVSGSLDKTLKYWDISCLADGPSGRPNSPGGSERYALSGNKNGGTHEGDSTCKMDFAGHEVCVELAGLGTSNRLVQDYVLSVAVSHDGKWVVSGSKDRGVRFWDPKSGIVQFTLDKDHENSGPLSSPADPTPRARVDSLPF